MAERPKRRTVKVTIGAVIVLILVGVTGGGGEGDENQDAGVGTADEQEADPVGGAATESAESSRDESAAKRPPHEGLPLPVPSLPSASEADRSTEGKGSPSGLESKLGNKSPATEKAGDENARSPGGESTEGSTDPVVDDPALVYEDLVASCIDIVEGACATREWDRAASALREAEAWPLDASRKQRLARVRKHWQDKLNLALAEILSTVEKGEPGRVHADAHTLSRASDSALHAVLNAALKQRGWPGWQLSIADGKRPSQGRALDRGRIVRVLHEDHWLRCKVVEERRGEVTVRIRTARGDLFPVFSRVEVEPLDLTSAELLDQAAAAIVVGDALRAALWLGSAKGRRDLDATRYADLLACFAPR